MAEPLAPVYSLRHRRPSRLSAGALVGIAARFRAAQADLAADKSLWAENAYVCECADMVERAAGARAVQELYAAHLIADEDDAA